MSDIMYSNVILSLTNFFFINVKIIFNTLSLSLSLSLSTVSQTNELKHFLIFFENIVIFICSYF